MSHIILKPQYHLIIDVFFCGVRKTLTRGWVLIFVGNGSPRANTPNAFTPRDHRSKTLAPHRAQLKCRRPRHGLQGTQACSCVDYVNPLVRTLLYVSFLHHIAHREQRLAHFTHLRCHPSCDFIAACAACDCSAQEAGQFRQREKRDMLRHPCILHAALQVARPDSPA